MDSVFIWHAYQEKRMVWFDFMWNYFIKSGVLAFDRHNIANQQKRLHLTHWNCN